MGGGVENLELLLLSPGKPRHWRRKWGQGGGCKAQQSLGSSAGAEHTRAGPLPPSPRPGGTEAVSGEETRRAEQEVSAPAWPARAAVGAAGVAIPAQRSSALQASPRGLEGRARGAGKGAGGAARPVAAGSRHSQRESLAACLIAVWLPQPGGSSSLG